MAIRILSSENITGKLTLTGQQELLELTRGGASDSKWFFSADSLKLYIAEGTSASNNIKMTLTDAGNVGIGTVSPLSKLTIDAPVGDFANGKNAISLNYDGGASPGNVGGGIVFSQKWWSASAGQQVTGGIYGIKHAGDGSYGGGLGFYTQPNGAANMAQHMVIRSTGEVGIGTDNPSSKLDVRGTGNFLGTAVSGAALVTIENDSGSTATSYGLLVKGGGNSNAGKIFEVRDDSGNTDLIIKGKGDVGIGTDNPDTKLQVVNAGEVIVRSSMTAADGFRGGFEADNQHTGGTIWSMFSTNNSDGYFGGGKFVIANESMGGVDANTTAQVVVDGSGNVGIGVTDPDAKLEIKATGATIGLTFKTTDASGNENFFIQDGGRTGVRYYPFTIGQASGTSAASGARFQIATTAGDFVVLNDGKTGIGTTSPDRTLDVRGSGLSIYGTGDNTELMLRGQVEGTGTVRNVGAFHLSIRADVGGDNDDLKFLKFINGTYSGIAMQIQNTTGTIIGNGIYTSNNSIKIFEAQRDGGAVKSDWSYDDASTDMSLGTSTAHSFSLKTGNTRALTINNSQNVGIGTTVPNSRLTIEAAGSQTTQRGITLFHNNTLAQGYISVGAQYTATNGYIDSEIRFGGETLNGACSFIAFATGCNNTVVDGPNSEKMRLTSGGNLGIGITSPNTKLDVSGTTGTRNRNTQGSSVYETSLYFNAAGNATTNISIDTTTAFPPIASGGFILVEVSASGYGNSGSNGLVFSYISGGYGGHYGGQGQAYHPVEIIANTMQAGSCTFYYPNSTTIGIAVTTTNSVGLNGLMRVKVTTTY